MTARDLITKSLKLIGVLSGNEAPSANEASDALSSLNDMLDLWSTQSLLIYAKTQEVFPLVASQQSYTMGPGGNFNTTRPQRIEEASLRINGTTTNDLPVEIITQAQWANITVKSVTSSIPTKLFEQNTYPLDTIYLWPVPSDLSKSLVLWSWKPLTNFATLDTVVNLPPGYNKTLKYNLGVELAPEYGKQVDPVIIAQAVGSKDDIKRMNSKTILLSQDASVVGHRKAFNYLTGE